MELTGKLLIAMPGMGDPRFQHSVVLLCSHGDEGAMGLIVNKPAHDISLSDLLEQLAIGKDGDGPGVDATVYFGGPVEPSRGFVLHGSDYVSNIHSLAVTPEIAMTATLDILEDMAAEKGPRKAMMILGYAGWGPEQLEGEIAMNGWLTVDADPELIFDLPDDEKWGAALGRLGVDPLTLSASAGRA